MHQARRSHERINVVVRTSFSLPVRVSFEDKEDTQVVNLLSVPQERIAIHSAKKKNGVSICMLKLVAAAEKSVPLNIFAMNPAASLRLSALKITKPTVTTSRV